VEYIVLAHWTQQDYDTIMKAPAEELSAIDRFLTEFRGELTASGELVDTHGLAAPALARRVQLRDGAQVVTDGPFAETEEVLAGFWVVDCASFDRATEIAARVNERPGQVSQRGTVVLPLLGADETDG
jgi:hypothetical protein